MEEQKDGQDFEDGIGMLLNRSYQRVEPRSEFRQELLVKLKAQQSRRYQRKSRAKILYLVSSVSAAAAVVALTLIPSVNPDAIQPGQSSLVAEVQTVAPVVSVNNNQDNAIVSSSLARTDEIVAAAPRRAPASALSAPVISPLSPSGVQLASTGFIGTSPVVSPADTEADSKTLLHAAQAVLTGYENAPDLATVKTVQALDSVEVRDPGQSEWTELARGAEFSPVAGTEIRTLGESSTALRLDKGSFIVLDQRGALHRTTDGYALDNGCAVISLADGRLNLQLGGKAVQVPQASRIFAQVRGGEQYAPGGEPAPVVVVMDGAVGIPEAPERPLLAGYAYRLFDTPTGIFPHHEVGGLERERFNRMTGVVLAGYEQ